MEGMLLRRRDNFIENWYSFNSATFFILLCLIYLAIYILKRVFIIDEIAAFEVLQERGEMWIFDLFFGLQHLSVPIYLAWKFTLTAFALWVGCFMFGYRVVYYDLWRWVMFAELVFTLPDFLKLAWFTMVANDPTFQEYQAFYPLSLVNLIDAGGRWNYPLKALNVFEIIYAWVLMIGVFYLSKKKWIISVYVVLTTYVPLFLLWLVVYILGHKG